MDRRKLRRARWRWRRAPWLELWRLAGSVGVDPLPLQMWELLAIARAHNYERWKHTSSVVWAAFQSQSAETIDPRLFHPMIARRKVRSRGQTLRPHQVRLEFEMLRARELRERGTLTSSPEACS